MRRRGFTLIEVVVVCAILSVLAALVYPNVVGMKSRRERDAAYADVLRLAQMGREVSIQGGQTYSLSLADGGTRVVLKQEEASSAVKDERTTTTDSASSKPSTPQPLPLGNLVASGSGPEDGSSSSSSGKDVPAGASVSLPSSVTLGDVSLNGKASTSSDFLLHFYPDGRSEGGGFEMVDGSTTRTLTVDRYGIAKLFEGKLPAASEPSWEAGQYEQRVQS